MDFRILISFPFLGVLGQSCELLGFLFDLGVGGALAWWVGLLGVV